MFGAPSEFIEDILSGQQADEFEVFDENRTPLEIFLRLSTQWLVGEGVVRGLNYQSAQWVISMFASDIQREIFEQIQVMEGAALDVFAAKNGA
ncbi:MAG: DUF1799 domain-containing protein [Acidocella sp.]|nr:DUF1799 domain-containing protein [Acidocella sp.]